MAATPEQPQPTAPRSVQLHIPGCPGLMSRPCALELRGACVQSDVLPLSDFNKQWTPQELDRQAPVYVERVSLRDALQGTLQNPRSLLNPIELVEPTFQVSRETSPGWGHARLPGLCSSPKTGS